MRQDSKLKTQNSELLRIRLDPLNLFPDQTLGGLMHDAAHDLIGHPHQDTTHGLFDGGVGA